MFGICLEEFRNFFGNLHKSSEMMETFKKVGSFYSCGFNRKHQFIKTRALPVFVFYTTFISYLWCFSSILLERWCSLDILYTSCWKVSRTMFRSSLIISLTMQCMYHVDVEMGIKWAEPIAVQLPVLLRAPTNDMVCTMYI